VAVQPLIPESPVAIPSFLDSNMDVEDYLNLVKDECSRALADVRLAFTSDVVGGATRDRATYGDLVVTIYHPHPAIGDRFQVYVGRTHYTSESCLLDARGKAYHAIGYYAGISPNMMGRYANAAERAKAAEGSRNL